MSVLRYRIPNIIKKTFTYGFFKIFSASIPFMLLPFLTRHLTLKDYGTLAIFQIIIMFLVPLFRLELQASIRREFVDQKKNFSGYISTAFIITLSIFLVVLLLWSILQVFIENLWGIPSSWFLGIILIVLGSTFYTYLIALYQIQDKASHVGRWEAIVSLLTFIPAIILIVFFDFNWEGRVWPQLVIALFIQLPISLYFIYKMFPYRFTFNFKYAKEMLKFSVPLIPSTLAIYIIMLSDRLFITKMIGIEAVGVYAVATQIAAVMMLAYNAFLPTWEVWVFRNLKDKSTDDYRKTVQLCYLFIISMLVLAFSLIYIFPYIMPLLLGKAFHGSIQYLSWLVFAVFMRSLFYLLHPFIRYTKKTNTMMYLVLFLASLNCVLNYVFILNQGAIGAARATFIVYLIGFLILFFAVQKQFKLPWIKSLKWQKISYS